MKVNREQNLLLDPMVRAEVVATIYKLIPANPMVSIFVSMLLLWQIASWPKHWLLISVLALWVAINLAYRNIAYTLQLAVKQRFDIARQHQELALLTSRLEVERERADAANAAKSNFFTAASHDARQPLQVISLLFQAVRKSARANEEDQQILDKIEINLNTILTLFDRVLDISRVDSGHVTPRPQALSGTEVTMFPPTVDHD